MSITEYALTRKTVTYVFMVILVGFGFLAFKNLGRLEDPEFTIKSAVITTRYPGAAPEQVEELVTDLIERSAQQLPQIKGVNSESREGVSTVTVKIKDKYDKSTLPQVWDELRRKINDAQVYLPAGAGPSVVNDDYGDIYGIMFAIYGNGFSYAELKKYADFLSKELLLVPEVAKISIKGNQQEMIYIEISTEKASALGISKATVFKTLENQNLMVPSGKARVGEKYITISPTGTFKSVEEIENLLLQSPSQNPTGAQIYLKDIAKVTRGYIDPPNAIWMFDGKPAVGLGISTVSGGNVVRMGEAVKKKLEKLKLEMPLGIKLGVISFQSDGVTASINGFVLSLVEALVIVIGILFIFMGWRSGLIIAFVLLFTIMGTFIFMYFMGINLERVSLGALIIALGMLVDNAIVITEGILVGAQKGMDCRIAAKNVVKRTEWPLFGATLIAILAFAGIGLSKDTTGEYCRSLFQVILISLSLSWVTAITFTPFLCVIFFKPKDLQHNGKRDPYRGFIFQSYKKILHLCLNFRWTVCIAMIALLLLSGIGFSYVKRSFFPDSTNPQFTIDYWLPEGTHIDVVRHDLVEISNYLDSLDGVISTAAFAGEGTLRFMLTYRPQKANTSYGFLLVSVDDYHKMSDLIPKINTYLRNKYPNAQPEVKKFVLGTGGGSSIVARFKGKDPSTLRELSSQVKAIMRSNPNANNIKDDWRDKVAKIRPIFENKKARAAGISEVDLSDALQQFFSGKAVGFYRENDLMLPIIARASEAERSDITNINNVSIWSPISNKPVPLRQVIQKFKTEWMDSVIRRKDRMRALEVKSDQKAGTGMSLFDQLRPKIEAIKLPSGYKLEWGGEYGESKEAKTALVGGLVISFSLMIITVIMLFNAIRQPLIIFLTLPLGIIGVTFGLLVTDEPFGFMALLGMLSLSGMIIKNAIILLDQIDLEIAEGKNRFQAILNSSVSRMRPVLMAAITTILGLTPLLVDAFFASMAVTIMFGLAFATILTLIVVPVLYRIFFRINEDANG